MGIVILSLPTLQEHSRIRGDDKCMRSMLKNITHYANMRDCQTSHLSFLLSGLAFLETRQHMQNPGSHLAHSRRTISGSCPRLMPLIWKVKNPLTPISTFLLPLHSSFQPASSYSPKLKQVRSPLASFPS